MNDRESRANIARVATPRSRRASLLGLSGATLMGAFFAPSLAEAGKGKKKANRKCKKQEGKCASSVMAFCAPRGPDAEFCLDQLLPCCAPLKTCQAAEAMTCFIP